MSKTAREIELEKKLEIAEKALTDVCLYRYDVSDTDQEDWFKIATCMAELAELKEKIKKREELIQCLGSNIDELDVKKSVLIIENNKLRGLLKECKEKIHQEFICSDYLSIDKFFDLLTRINAAIGESEEK